MEQMHVMNLVIAEDVGVSTTAAGQRIDALADLVDGEWKMVNDENLILDAATVLTDDRAVITGFRFLGRVDNELVRTDMIRLDDIINIRARDYLAATQQVTHVGYTGTGGAIQVLNNNVYKIKIDFYESGRTGQGLRDFVSAFYESDATATGTEIAFGIEELLRKSFDRQPERPVQIDVLNSAAVVAGNALDENITVVQGSKFITSAVDYDYGGVDLAVGDLLRIGTVGAATALTDDVYRVVALTSATVTELDRPVTSASGLYATATDDIEVIPAASIVNYGLQFTGIARTHQVGKHPYSQVNFTVGIEDFGTTAVTYTTPPVYGYGLYQQIRDLEWFTHGQEGDRYRSDYMHLGYISNVVAAHTYVQLAISWAPGSRVESIGGPGHNPKQLIIAVDDAFANTESPDLLIEAVDGVMGAMGLTASGLAK